MTTYPFMPFYVADFQADTMHLNWKEKAAYRALLDAYWIQGSGPKNDDKRLARIIGMTTEEWTEVKESVLEFFTTEGGSLVQKRIEIEIAKAKQITESAKEKAAKRWKKDENREEPCHSNAPAMPQHSHSNAAPMPSTSTSTSTGLEDSLGSEAELDPFFADAEKSAPEKYDPEEYQTEPDQEHPAFTTHPSVPGLKIPSSLNLTGKQLLEAQSMFGRRTEEALVVIANILAAKDYGYKSHWAGVKTWFAKEGGAIAWLDKATGRASAETTVRPEIYRPFVHTALDGIRADPDEIAKALGSLAMRHCAKEAHTFDSEPRSGVG